MSDEENVPPTDADLLLAIAEQEVGFVRWQGRCYATVTTKKGQRTLQVRGPAFQTWLRLRFREHQGRIPPAAAVKAAITAIEDIASLAPEQPVFLRSARDGGRIYIDLGDETGAAIEMASGQWRIVPAPPVRFVRGNLTRPMPMPAREGGLDLLRSLLNLVDDGSFQLLATWCVAALMPEGPYPLLVIGGEQGSAKTTTAKLVHDLVDPSRLPLRALPRSERDLYISTSNTHVLAFDNISSIDDWLSDTLCKLATGGGMATRQLFTDSGEVYFEAIKPVILNSIADVVTRPDLADRAVILNLPAIAEEERLDPGAFTTLFQARHPQILGTLLDLMAMAVDRLPTLKTDRLPRMAGFARIGIAIEHVFGPPGCFLEAYDRNRSMSSAILAESDPIVSAVSKLAHDHGPWNGTATDLARALEPRMVPPKRLDPAALAGRLRRLAPVLRSNGVGVEFDRVGKDRTRTIAITRRAA
ncbi:MAG: hypothetical protein Q8R85_06115 [Bosea sp. (in: a-proteobacteria)]|jgi:hypothetical protein|uniref:hypothetical protein n=1 Tax=Hyphomicrobiales TaxID=356 RepID=UPI000836E2BC|nr:MULTISPECIES: hypothetical protein [Hyphomicrobiales]MDP3600731.1 hypothetical protein [Bosea sp. (in: a-proteobacteria)]